MTPIVPAFSALRAAIITAKVIPWIKSKTTTQQQILLNATVGILVAAAEQLYGAGHGAEKLAYVKNELELRGFTVDTAAIESAVRELTA